MTNGETERLIARIAAGDGEAAALLYKEFSGPVYFFALKMLRNEADAEDAMQETFIAILQKSGAYKPHEKASAWIFTIAKNKALDRLRKRRDYAELDSPEAAGLADADADDIGYPELLQSLSEKERDVVTLRVLSGFTLTQIARDLDIPKGTVFWTYNNAMKKLRKKLKEGGCE